MQHERVKKVDVAYLARRLDKVRARLRPLPEYAQVFLLWAMLGSGELAAGDHAGGDAFGVVVEVLGDFCHAVGADDGAAAGGRDIGVEGQHEQGLFGRVEVVREEVAVGVPAFEVVRVGDAVVAGEGTEVYDEVVLAHGISFYRTLFALLR